MLVHSVYFWLKPELTPAQRADFRRGLETLKGITCVERVFVGAPAPVPDRPVVDKSVCVGCGHCHEACPTGAASVKGGKANIECKNCIRCFCCQELCPKGAITVHRTWMARMLGK